MSLERPRTPTDTKFALPVSHCPQEVSLPESQVPSTPNKQTRGKTTYSVHNIKDDAHTHAELLKVEISVIVNIRYVPNALELVVPQAAVLEEGRGLLARKVRPAIGPRGKDIPVRLDLGGLDARRHCGGNFRVCVCVFREKAGLCDADFGG